MQKYKCIVVDPPWDYGVSANNHHSMRTLPDRGRRGQTNLRRWPRKSPDSGRVKTIKPHERVIAGRPKKNRPYLGEGQYAVTDGYKGVMDVKAIKRFDLVRRLADNACLVFLWTTNKFLEDAFKIIEYWGFENLPLTMVWDKGNGPQFPNSPSYHAEFVVVGRRGKFGKKIWLSTKEFHTILHSKPGAHSEKPSYFYELLRRVTRGPRVDLFARRRHVGFDAWGNQVMPLVPYNDMFKSNFPETKVVKISTGELHSEDWESWEKKRDQQIELSPPAV